MKQNEQNEICKPTFANPSSLRTQSSTIQIRLTCMMMCWQPPHSPQMTEAAALSHLLLFARSHLPSPTTRPLQFCIPTVACVIDELPSMWAASPGWVWVTKNAYGWAGGRALGGDGIFRNHCCTVLCSDGVGFLFPGIRLDWSLKENYPEDVLVPKKAMIKWVVAFSAILLLPLTLGLYV